MELEASTKIENAKLASQMQKIITLKLLRQLSGRDPEGGRVSKILEFRSETCVGNLLELKIYVIFGFWDAVPFS